MIFGLPWFAVVAILVPLAGMFYAYKEKELKAEEKRYMNAKESQELRKMILSLKSRIENLETIITEQDEEAKADIPLDDIEIKDENAGQGNTRSKVRG
jgi:Flp pilus assembly protein TadB